MTLLDDRNNVSWPIMFRLKLTPLPARGSLLFVFLTIDSFMCLPWDLLHGNRLLQFCDKMVTKSRTSAINVGADIIRPKETDGSNQHFHGLYDIA